MQCLSVVQPHFRNGGFIIGEDIRGVMNTAIREFVLFIQRKFNGYPRGVGKKLESMQKDANREPVFIIGNPRSGSTLLYQYIIRHCRVGYISNAMALFPKYMPEVFAFTEKQIRAYDSIKESKYGYIPGVHSPNEAGKIFRKWFREGMSGSEQERVRRTVQLLTCCWREPVIFKNMHNSLRLDRIRDIFPEARFIFIKRNPLYIAQSILVARKKNTGTISKEWWDTDFPDYEQVAEKNPYYQVLWKTYQLEKLIQRFLDSSGLSSVEVEYKHFCRNPSEVIGEICTALDLKEKPDKSYMQLQVRDSRKIDREEWDRLFEEFQKVKESECMVTC